MNEFADLLNRQMALMGLKSSQLAAKSGVSSSYISKMLNSGMVPQLKILRRLAEPLGLEVDELIRAADRGSDELASRVLQVAFPFAAWMSVLVGVIYEGRAASEFGRLTSFGNFRDGKITPTFSDDGAGQLDVVPRRPGTLRKDNAGVRMFTGAECIRLLREQVVDAAVVATDAYEDDDAITRVATVLSSVGAMYLTVIGRKESLNLSVNSRPWLILDELWSPGGTNAERYDSYLHAFGVRIPTPDAEPIQAEPIDSAIDGWSFETTRLLTDELKLKQRYQNARSCFLSSVFECQTAPRVVGPQPDQAFGLNQWSVPRRTRIVSPVDSFALSNLANYHDLLERIKSRPEHLIGAVLWQPHTSWLKHDLPDYDVRLYHPPYYAMVKGTTDRYRSIAEPVATHPGIWSRFDLVVLRNRIDELRDNQNIKALLKRISLVARRLSEGSGTRVGLLDKIAGYFDIDPTELNDVLANLRYDVTWDLEWQEEG